MQTTSFKVMIDLVEKGGDHSEDHVKNNKCLCKREILSLKKLRLRKAMRVVIKYLKVSHENRVVL